MFNPVAVVGKHDPEAAGNAASCGCACGYGAGHGGGSGDEIFEDDFE